MLSAMSNTMPSYAGALRDLCRGSDTMSEKKKRDKVATRQQCALEKHILRQRNNDKRAVSLSPVQPKKRSPSGSASSKPKVGIFHPLLYLSANNLKQSIAARILLNTLTDLRMLSTLARTKAYVEAESVSTYSLLDERTRSTPSPAQGNRRDSLETTKTASCGSCEKESRAVVELQLSLKEKDSQIAELRSKYEQNGAILVREEESHGELKKKYATQIAQRLNDKSMVDRYYEAYQNADEECARLEGDLEVFRKEYSEAKQQWHTKMQAKERRIAKLQDEHRSTIDALEVVHKKEMAAKEEEVKNLWAVVVEKDVELDGAIKKAADERREYKTKAADSQRKMVKASKIHWRAAEKMQQKLQHDLDIRTADCQDALQENEKKVTDLIHRNHQLEKEYSCLSEMLKQKFPDVEELREIIDDNFQGLQDERNLRANVMQMREQIENLLDRIQQMGVQLTSHQHKEQDAVLDQPQVRCRLCSCDL
jgi:DNA repair exonuclease SbcCD ATPase subunit